MNLNKEISAESEKSQSEVSAKEDEMLHEVDVEQLIADLKNPDKTVRKTAIITLGQIGDERAVQPLMTVLKDDELLDKWAAETALGKIGAPAFDPLMAAFKESDVEMRGSAVGALGKMGDERAVEPLIAALKTEDKDLRMSIVTALGRIGDKRAVEHLILSLKDKWDVGACAAEALGSIGDQRAVEPLIDAIKNADWALWPPAAKSLGQIGDPRAVPALKSLLKDSNTSIKNAASEALEAIEASPNRHTESEQPAEEEKARATTEKSGEVRFVRKYTKPIIAGFEGTYMEYEADSIIDARIFLATQNVTAPRFYIEVHTPDGGLGKDIDGTYEVDV